ncbi:DUF3817 domain-containing protein [Zobellia nedashkovskayae]
MPNKYVGYAHGALFITYVILAVVLWMEQKWSIKKGIIILIASLLPFATFYVEKKIPKRCLCCLSVRSSSTKLSKMSC